VIEQIKRFLDRVEQHGVAIELAEFLSARAAPTIDAAFLRRISSAPRYGSEPAIAEKKPGTNDTVPL
jgi:hypothetical protein